MTRLTNALFVLLLCLTPTLSAAESHNQVLNYEVVVELYRDCLFNYSGGGDSAGGSVKDILPEHLPDALSPELLWPDGYTNGQLGTGTPAPSQGDRIKTTPRKPFNISFEHDEETLFHETPAEVTCWQQISYDWNDILIMRTYFKEEIRRLIDQGRFQEATRLLSIRAYLYGQEDA